MPSAEWLARKRRELAGLAKASYAWWGVMSRSSLPACVCTSNDTSMIVLRLSLICDAAEPAAFQPVCLCLLQGSTEQVSSRRTARACVFRSGSMREALAETGRQKMAAKCKHRRVPQPTENGSALDGYGRNEGRSARLHRAWMSSCRQRFADPGRRGAHASVLAARESPAPVQTSELQVPCGEPCPRVVLPSTRVLPSPVRG